MDQITDQNLKSCVQANLDGVIAWANDPYYDRDVEAHRNMVFECVPRYKPYLQDVPEYFVMGLDQAETLLDSDLTKSCSAKGSLSFLLCGSSDARHLFQTILNMQALEERTGAKVCKDVHFTLLDVNPTVMVRTLLFFMSAATRKQALHYLKRWQEPLEDTPCNRTATVRRVTQQRLAESVGVSPWAASTHLSSRARV